MSDLDIPVDTKSGKRKEIESETNYIYMIALNLTGNRELLLDNASDMVELYGKKNALERSRQRGMANDKIT